MRTQEEWLALFQTNGLPPPPEGVINDARWIMSTDDWWVLVGASWFWIRGDNKARWVPSQYGPA